MKSEREKMEEEHKVRIFHYEALGVKTVIWQHAALEFQCPKYVIMMFSTQPHAAHYSRSLNVHTVCVCVCRQVRDNRCWFIGVIPPH